MSELSEKDAYIILLSIMKLERLSQILSFVKYYEITFEAGHDPALPVSDLRSAPSFYVSFLSRTIVKLDYVQFLRSHQSVKCRSFAVRFN